MKAEVTKGLVVARQPDRAHDNLEIVHEFRDLEELFALFMVEDSMHLIERIEINGIAPDGRNRKLTLVFESMIIEEAS